jgi:4-hydroxybenzoyl-CoA thioesterase
MATFDSTQTLPAEAEGGFTVTRKIRFGETDPAGIVYYPNYFNMFNEIVEDWFEEELHMSFKQLHQVQNMGVPMAHVECDFVAPCTLGERISITLLPTQLGRTSLQMLAVISAGTQVRVRATMVVVFVDLSTYRSVEPSDALRDQIHKRMVTTVR